MKPVLKISLQLLIFFFLAFAIAWGAWIPSFVHPDSLRLLVFIGLFAPALAALIISYYLHRWKGINELLAKYALFRFGVTWYTVAILLLPVLFFLSILLDHVFFQTSFKNIFLPNSPFFIFIAFVWLMFINSGEEIGWRGFALPKLLKLFKNPVYATLLLGMLWSTWHLPLYLTPGQSSFPFILFFFFTLGLSFIYSVLHNKTKGSLFSAVLLHASTDVAPRVVNIALFKPTTWLILGILTWAGAIVLIYNDKYYWRQSFENKAINGS